MPLEVVDADILFSGLPSGSLEDVRGTGFPSVAKPVKKSAMKKKAEGKGCLKGKGKKKKDEEEEDAEDEKHEDKESDFDPIRGGRLISLYTARSDQASPDQRGN